jgi:hypothetical protein
VTRAYKVGRSRVDLKGKVLVVTAYLHSNGVDTNKGTQDMSAYDTKGRQIRRWNGANAMRPKKCGTGMLAEMAMTRDHLIRHEGRCRIR